jgi:hypothetical protein
MLIAELTNPVPLDYRAAFPNTSFPQSGPDDDFLAANGYARVNAFKEHDRATEKLIPAEPYFEAPWVYTVAVAPKSAEELAAEQAAAVQALQAGIVAAVQARLDDFARTRNYDGILSAATYAASTVPKFAAEGQYAVTARDQTWATLYAILAEVQAGTRPVPTGYADIEADLPVLEWPAA